MSTLNILLLIMVLNLVLFLLMINSAIGSSKTGYFSYYSYFILLSVAIFILTIWFLYMLNLSY